MPRNKPKDGTKGTCSLISLGCPKNLVDSERMLGLLNLHGFRLSPQPEGSDFVVINTCGFLQAARDESLETIREIVRLKQRGSTRGVIVTGCMAQRDQELLLEQCPGIDQVVGLHARDEIALAADRLMDGFTQQRTLFRPAPARPLSDAGRLRVTPPHLAFLKISEGCDRLCTFCSIPQIRGKHSSKPMDEVVAEAE
ncbi:MAG: 30S ribosomal protein S12 methylthiotransferase RimO, partial [Pirellulales bacterium]|nr:30S ribosomal protein S12 methylthiotransferase RimO [Pirellulales bacterium]